MRFEKNSRKDYTEYDVYTDNYSIEKDGEQKEALVGQVTKFGKEKWVFRTAGKFFCDVSPTESFKSRKACMDEVEKSLRFIHIEPKPEPIELNMARLMRKPAPKNNKRRTRGRKIQYINLPNGKQKRIIHV